MKPRLVPTVTVQQTAQTTILIVTPAARAARCFEAWEADKLGRGLCRNCGKPRQCYKYRCDRCQARERKRWHRAWWKQRKTRREARRARETIAWQRQHRAPYVPNRPDLLEHPRVRAYLERLTNGA